MTARSTCPGRSAVIETIQARCDVSTWIGNGMDLVMSLDDPEKQRGLWTYGRGGSAVAKGAPITLTVSPVSVGKTKGNLQVVATANLPRLLYGDTAKSLTLPGRDVGDGVAAL